LQSQQEIERRLARVEDRQADVLTRLARIDERLEAVRQHGWEIDQKIVSLGRPNNVAAPSSPQWEFARAVVFGLLAVVAALGGAKILNLASLIGGG
jgi:hypothetical protein